MAIIKVVNGAFVEYYDRWKLEEDYPNESFPPNFLVEENLEIVNYNVYPCRVLPKPLNVDEDDFNVVPDSPRFVGGEWVQDWLVTEKSPDEKQQARYNPDDFLLGLNQDSAYQTWSNLLPPNPYSNFLLAVQRASESRNWVHVQVFYDGFKQAIAPSAEAIVEWQKIAEKYGIPITF